MVGSINLAEELAKTIKHGDADITMDQFLDKYEIPESARTDLAIAMLLRQAKEMIESGEV